jgi:hypothetical protein
LHIIPIGSDDVVLGSHIADLWLILVGFNMWSAVVEQRQISFSTAKSGTKFYDSSIDTVDKISM